jgi:hypothetical protein
MEARNRTVVAYLHFQQILDNDSRKYCFAEHLYDETFCYKLPLNITARGRFITPMDKLG